MKHLPALTFLWRTGNEMNHIAVDTSRPTLVYSPTSGAQVMTFPKSDLIPSEALCLYRTAIIINLKKNPTSLSNFACKKKSINEKSQRKILHVQLACNWGLLKRSIRHDWVNFATNSINSHIILPHTLGMTQIKRDLTESFEVHCLHTLANAQHIDRLTTKILVNKKPILNQTF